MADTNVVPRRRGARVPRRALAVLAAVLLAATAACSGSSSDAGRAAEPLRKDAPEQADRQAQSKGQAARRAPVAERDRAMVYTADMTIRVRDVAGSTARAKSITADAGGYVGSEDTTHADRGGEHDVSTLVLRVPVEKYRSSVDRIGRAVGKPRSLRQTSQDKTTEVADVQSRITSAETSIKRLRKIMDKATTVSDIMSVEGAISSRESDLESLQAQAKALDRQTSYSTINLSLVGPKTVIHKKSSEPGFFDGLTGGWHALLTFLRVAVLVLGTILPFAALATVLATPLWWLWRRHRARPTPAE